MRLLLTLVLAFIVPSAAMATPVSWDQATGVLQPLQSGWSAQIKGSYFQSTSTAELNRFPNIRSTNATTTNATTTALDVLTLLTFGGTTGNSWDDFCTAVTGGSGLCDGTDNTGSGSEPFPGNATSTTLRFDGGALFTASSTISANATTTGTQGVGSLFINGERFSDLTGAGLAMSSNALTVDDVTPAMLQAADFGSFTCNGTNCAIDNGAVSNAMLANSTISGVALGSNLADLSATNGTLTFSGSYNGSAARTIGINLSNANTWTGLQTITYASSTASSFSYASSTDLRAGTLRIGSLSGVLVASTGLVSTGADGTDFTLINASTCTNQVHTAATAAGVFTCSSINDAFWSGTDLSVANGGTGASTFTNNRLLTGNGTSALVDEGNLTFDGTTLTIIGGITSNGTSDFGGASGFEIPNGTSPTVDADGECAIDTTSGQLKCDLGAATEVIGNGSYYASFSYATTTAWTGTTTIPLGPAFVGEIWNGVKCFTDIGTAGVSFYDGTNRMEYLNASTTVGTFGFAANNTFTASEKRYVDIGTPGSSPTKVACTVDKSITAD